MAEQIQPQIQANPVVQQPVADSQTSPQNFEQPKKKKKLWIWLLIFFGILILVWLGIVFFV